MEKINMFQSISGILMIFVLFSIFLGFVLKIYSILFAIFAFPTYLGLYFIESSLPLRNKKGERILYLNIPNKNPQKAIMNSAATLVTLSLLPLVEVVFNMLRSPEAQVKVLEAAFTGKLTSPILLVFFSMGLFTIYIVSYFFTEKDENGPWTKIENLNIPSLWKVVAKGVV